MTKILLMFSRRVNKNEKIYTKRAHEMGKFYKENKIKLEMIFWRRNFKNSLIFTINLNNNFRNYTLIFFRNRFIF